MKQRKWTPGDIVSWNDSFGNRRVGLIVQDYMPADRRRDVYLVIYGEIGEPKYIGLRVSDILDVE